MTRRKLDVAGTQLPGALPADSPVGRRRAGATRQPYGSGSLYRDASGTWVATSELPPERGKRRRLTGSGRTPEAALARLRAKTARSGVAGSDLEPASRPGAATSPTAGTTAGTAATGLAVDLCVVDAFDPSRPTADWLRLWLEQIVPDTITVATLAGYRSVLRRDVLPYVGHVPLAELGPQHVLAMMRALTDRGLSPRTVAYARALLRRALTIAVRWDVIRRNAAALVDPPRQAHRDPEHLSLAEAHQFLAAAPHDRLGPLFVLTLVTGLRRSEVLALQWHDIDLDAPDGPILHVRAALTRVDGLGLVRGEPKSRSSRRTVPLPPLAAEQLRTHHLAMRTERLALGRPLTGDDYVFTTWKGTPLDPRNLTRLFHQYCATAGLPRQRFHALRHSAATLMLSEGVPLAVISKTLGHSGIAITADIYASVVPQLQRDAADALQRALGGSRPSSSPPAAPGASAETRSTARDTQLGG